MPENDGISPGNMGDGNPHTKDEGFAAPSQTPSSSPQTPSAEGGRRASDDQFSDRYSSEPTQQHQANAFDPDATQASHRHEEPTRTHSWGASDWRDPNAADGPDETEHRNDPYGVPPTFTSEHGPRRGTGFLRWAAVVVVSALVGGLVATWSGDDSAGPVTRSDASTAAANQASNAPATPTAIRGVLQKVEPAVVTIDTQSGSGSGTGTGMIVSTDGEILTNNHVVAGASRIQVTLNNETTPRTARLLGADQTIDTALLKIDGSNLPTVAFGDSTKAQVGDEVVAIGNALALTGGPSVTSGIISAKDRSITDSTSSLSNLIQTDTAINPGNSGGPLANMAGEVIGMNTAVIRGSTGEYENIGFSIAINTVRPAINDLRNGQSRQPAYLGLNPVTLDDSIRERYNLSPQQGVVVSQVAPDAPADQAGLSRFDVITQLDGRDVTSSDALINAVREKRPGDQISITYYRGDERRTTTATLSSRPAQ